MRLEELMSEAKCCKQEDTVRDAARLMRDEDIGFVPICDAGGKPIGAITDRDLAIRVLADGRGGDEKLGAFMTRDVVSAKLGDDVQDAQRLMRGRKLSRIMVCDDAGKLRGVVSLADLARGDEDEEVGETVEQVKSDRPAAH